MRRERFKSVRNIGSIQLTTKGFGLDHGARPSSTTAIRTTKTVSNKPSNVVDEEVSTKDEEVFKVWSQTPSRGARQSGRYRRPIFRCYTCGRTGHGWRSCPDRKDERARGRGPEMRQYSTSRSPQHHYKKKGMYTVSNMNRVGTKIRRQFP